MINLFLGVSLLKLLHLVYNLIMKLIIQIPCYNEEETLGITYNDIPKQIEGVDSVEILVIDDGSVDNTVQVAEKLGVNYIVRHPRNLGLARAFSTGLKECIKHNADIIVNLDADNQYKASDIGKLIKPILEGKADIVVGARPIETIKSFSLLKKILQKMGSFVMRKISGTSVEDAPSGFRAFTRNAAIQINIFDNYTYTLETIIQARKKGLEIASVPIGVNKDLRKSRLVKSNFDYILRSCFTMMRFVIIYSPFKFFRNVSFILLALAAVLAGRFLYFYFLGSGNGHVQSLILCTILITIGVQSLFFAVIADLLAINRKLSEDIQIKIQKLNEDK